MSEKRLSDLNWPSLLQRQFQPSPLAWEDQVLYFLLPDRFSDGKEKGYRDNIGNKVTTGSTPPFDPKVDNGNAIQTPVDAANWRDAGAVFVGGNLKGLTTKLGYLSRIGVTAIWVGPIFKQVAFQQTYHGYGVQNFLDVDPHFGTRDDLRTLVDTAHAKGIIFTRKGRIQHWDDDPEFREGDLNQAARRRTLRVR